MFSQLLCNNSRFVFRRTQKYCEIGKLRGAQIFFVRAYHRLYRRFNILRNMPRLGNQPFLGRAFSAYNIQLGRRLGRLGIFRGRYQPFFFVIGYAARVFGHHMLKKEIYVSADLCTAAEITAQNNLFGVALPCLVIRQRRSLFL